MQKENAKDMQRLNEEVIKKDQNLILTQSKVEELKLELENSKKSGDNTGGGGSGVVNDEELKKELETVKEKLKKMKADLDYTF